MAITYKDVLATLKELNGKVVTSSGLGHTELRIVAHLAGVSQNIAWWIHAANLSDAGTGFDGDGAAYSSSSDPEGGALDIRIRDSKVQIVGGGLSRTYQALNISPVPNAVAPSEPKGSAVFSRPSIFLAYRTGMAVSSGRGRPRILNTDSCLIAFATTKVSIPH